MTDWSEGYMVEVDYTYGYFDHLNPLHMRLAMLSARLNPPTVETACELGFGQGVTVSIHAAASSVTWHGNDFNPGHAAFANRLASASGATTILSDESFAEYCRRPDLPNFDYIALHGIWSWISDANRSVIVDFVRRKLKPGGVLCISYNTLHGWAAVLPLRDLLRVHAARMSPPGLGMVSRVDAALAFADQVLAGSPTYVKAHPELVQGLIEMKRKGRHYLAGEYFGDHWHPMSFADMAGWLGAAKISYACSAKPLDHVAGARLTQQQQTRLNSIVDPVYRQTVFDVFVNQSFRMDYWVKGGQPLSADEQSIALRDQRVVLIGPTDEVTMTATAPSGDPFMNPDDFASVIDALGDHQPRKLGELAQVLEPRGMDFDSLFRAVLLLVGAGRVRVAQADEAISLARASASSLNLALLRKVRAGPDLGTLASPVTGGGVSVRRYHQLFLLARAEGLHAPADWARAVWRYLVGQGERVVRAESIIAEPTGNLEALTRVAREKGRKDPEAWALATWAFLKESEAALVKQLQPLLTPEDELEELTAQAEAFAAQTLPRLTALGVA